MYLQKLEIQGFKSFAGKNSLSFPEKGGGDKKGMTAVVGPNGSGKSNIADAIRWALGEQSMKTLRAKTSEDVIFSGSLSRGQLSMAEVSLCLNNEDGQAPIDYSELVITRRLFRNGESEYLLNNSRARLSDIQILLAKANFGQKTYSVIGQGMVEGFLQTSASERKDFFDEATGVKQFQIKRDLSLNKLVAGYENLEQCKMLLGEIEPRLKSLTKQVNRLRKREELEKELKEKRLVFFRHGWHKLNDKLREHNELILETEEEQRKKIKELEKQNEEIGAMEEETKNKNENQSPAEELSELQKQREEILTKITAINTRLSMEMEAKGNFDLSWLFNKKSELEKEIKENEQAIINLTQYVCDKKSGLSKFEEEKIYLTDQIDSLNKKLLGFSQNNESEQDENYDKKIEEKLKEIKDCLENLEKEEDPETIKELLKNAKIIIEEIFEINKKGRQNSSAGLRAIMEKQREIQEQLIKLSKEKESLMFREGKNELEIRAEEEKIRTKEKNLQKLKEELGNIQEKISQNSENKKGADSDLDGKKENLEIDLKNIDEQVQKIKEEINQLNKKEDEKRFRLFKLQKEGQILQQNINELTNRLNELKIEAAKYETKLEDLESQIRETVGNIREISEQRGDGEINIEETEAEIKRLENQCGLIGGIDPTIEKEYEEIKERYDFLSGQINDLESATKSLEEIIRELDEKIKEKFNKEFKIICNKFEEYFKILFSGGSAKIIKLTNEDLEKENEKSLSPEEAEMENEKLAGEKIKNDSRDKIKKLSKHNATGLSGIEIHACPPGKKIKSLSMLSGGEKALVAIAMICAIISANPSPFVVLDEVDAALDESNSERLSKILDDLSNKTQFILITHNRATMSRADILYGVTMQENGVSKLLSVKLEDYIKK